MPRTANTSIAPVWFVLAAVLLWSTGGLFIKLTTLDAFQVTFFRSLLAAVTVVIVTRRHGLRINAFGVVVTIIYAALLFLFVWATKQTTAANAIFLQYTAPIYILILAPFVIGERFHFRDVVTVIFCLAGMSLFFVGDLTTGDYQGNIAALGSGVLLGLYIMLLKHPKAESLNPVITVIYGNLVLALLTLPSGLEAITAAVQQTSAEVVPFTQPLKDLACVAFLGIFQIGISYILFIKGVRGGTRPLDASIIGFIEPLLNPVWVFLFVDERPSNWAVLGGAIIIATVAAHTFAQYRNKRSPGPAVA